MYSWNALALERVEVFWAQLQEMRAGSSGVPSQPSDVDAVADRWKCFQQLDAVVELDCCASKVVLGKQVM